MTTQQERARKEYKRLREVRRRLEISKERSLRDQLRDVLTKSAREMLSKEDMTRTLVPHFPAYMLEFVEELKTRVNKDIGLTCEYRDQSLRMLLANSTPASGAIGTELAVIGPLIKAAHRHRKSYFRILDTATKRIQENLGPLVSQEISAYHAPLYRRNLRRVAHRRRLFDAVRRRREL